MLAGPLVEKAVPERLFGATVRAALAGSSTTAGTAILTTAVRSLAETVLKAMFLARLGLVVAAVTMAAAGMVTAIALAWTPMSAESRRARSTMAGRADRAGAAEDRFGDPLPEGTVARLGSIRFRGGDRPVNALRFSPDGHDILTVSQDFLVRLWETKTGRLLREFLPGSGSASSQVGIAFSPDGKQIALSGTERAAGDKPGYDPVRLVVNAATGKELSRLPVRTGESDLALAFTPDGKSLISLGQSGVFRIEEIATGDELLHREFPRDSTGSMVLSPDGKLAAIWTGANTRKLYLWNWQGAGEPRELKVPRDRIDCPIFSHDGKAVLACDDLEPFVYEWDVTTGDLKHEIALRDDIHPNGLAITPDGQTIAVTDYGNQRGKNFSGCVLLLERATGKLVGELATPGTSAKDVVFSPDSRWLATASGVGVHVWDWRAGEEVAAGADGHRGSITQMGTAPGGLIATASDDHTVRVWDAASGTERRKLPHGHWVRAIAVSPDGRFLASSSLDDCVRLWDLPTGKEIYKLPGHGLHGGSRTVGFTADGRRFLSYGDDVNVRIWDVRTGKALFENAVGPAGGANVKGLVDPGGHPMRMLGGAAFSPDGQRLVAWINGSLSIIESATGRVEKSVEHPGGHVMSIAVAPDGRTFATSGAGRPIRRKLPDGRLQSTTPINHPVCLFELVTGKLIRELEIPSAFAGPVAFSADGKLLAIGCGRGRGEVRLVDLATWETVAVLTDFMSKPHVINFSADGKSLVTGLNDATALVWDLARVLAPGARKEER